MPLFGSNRKSKMFRETNNQISHPSLSTNFPYEPAALPLADKIRFVLICSSFLQSFARRFPVFDIDARPEPFHDVSVFIMKWQLTM